MRTQKILSFFFLTVVLMSCSKQGELGAAESERRELPPPQSQSAQAMATPEPTLQATPEPVLKQTPQPQFSASAPPLREGEKLARCEIRPDRYSGPCVFRAEANGSFYLKKPDASVFYGNVTNISVSIVEQGRAEVFGLTTRGNNSRWGSAERSQSDRACWVGADFEVCAY